MFWLRDLRFLLCSLHLDILCAKDHGRFSLNFPQINEVGNQATILNSESILRLILNGC